MPRRRGRGNARKSPQRPLSRTTILRDTVVLPQDVVTVTVRVKVPLAGALNETLLPTGSVRNEPLESVQ